jgi:hypothetical protein
MTVNASTGKCIQNVNKNSTKSTHFFQLTALSLRQMNNAKEFLLLLFKKHGTNEENAKLRDSLEASSHRLSLYDKHSCQAI